MTTKIHKSSALTGLSKFSPARNPVSYILKVTQSNVEGDKKFSF